MTVGREFFTAKTVAEALAALDADVVIDAGRLLPHFAGGIGSLLSAAQVLLVLCPPTLAGIVHLKTALPSLIATSSLRQFLVLPTASKGFSSEEIASTLKINVAPAVPHDPKGAAALNANASGSERSKTALAKWARSTAAELVASSPTHVPLSPPEITNHPLRSPVTDTKQLNDTAQSLDIEPLCDTVPLVAPTWVAR